jgi:hypothetical protein
MCDQRGAEGRLYINTRKLIAKNTNQSHIKRDDNDFVSFFGERGTNLARPRWAHDHNPKFTHDLKCFIPVFILEVNEPVLASKPVQSSSRGWEFALQTATYGKE